MKIWIQVIFLSALQLVCLSQTTQPTNTSSTKRVISLKEKLADAKDDSTRVETMQRIGFFYERLDVDSSLKILQCSAGRLQAKILWLGRIKNAGKHEWINGTPGQICRSI